MRNADQNILGLALDIPLWVIFCSILLSTLGGFFNAILWYRLIKDQNETSSFSSSYWAWSVSRIFRYIPGKVFGYAVRHGLEKSSLKQGISASLNELLVVLGSLMFLGGCFFLFSIPVLALAFLLSFMLIVFCQKIAILSLKFLPFQLSHILNPEVLSDSRRMFGSMVIVFPAMLAHTAAFYLIMTSGLGEVVFSFVRSAVVFYFSGLAGQLAIVVPGGLGVRESVMAYLSNLSGVTEGVAVCAALTSRILLLFAELVNVVLSGFVKRFSA